MKRFLKKIFKKPHLWFLSRIESERFNPKLLGIFINPFYFSRRGLYKNIKSMAPNISGRILDVGCGIKPYKDLFKYEKYDGLEIDTPKTRKIEQIDYHYTGQFFPFENSVYDTVLCSQTFEHIFEPDAFLQEINRVLKKNGFLLLTVPFIWDEHEQPHDYARYSSFGISHILKKNNFKIIEYCKSVNNLAVPFQLINGYLYKKTRTKSLYINIVIAISVMFPVNIIGIILSLLLPKNNDLYLDNVVLAQKIK